MRQRLLCAGICLASCAASFGAEEKDPTASREYRRIATWIKQLDHADARKRAHAAFVLGNIGSREGIAPMVKLLGSGREKSPRVVLALCYALGQLKAREAYELELKALGHADAGVRNHAAWALGEIGILACSPELIRLLADPDAMVRRRAVESLRKLSGKSFGYAPGGGRSERAGAAKKWAGWWRADGARLSDEQQKKLRSGAEGR